MAFQAIILDEITWERRGVNVDRGRDPSVLGG